jgi:riboflavin biosynthesis pyrimidine reductase
LILQEVFPKSGTLHDLTTEAVLSELYPKVNGFRLNYVVSPSAVSADSNLASNTVDRTLLKNIRSQSDLIITTGKTARDEALNSSSFAPMLILTQQEEALQVPAVDNNSKHPVYLTQKLGTIYQNSKALAVGISQNNVTQFAESFCPANSFTNVVLETGMTLARQFAERDLIAELNLSVTGVTLQHDAEKALEDFLDSLILRGFQSIQLLNHNDSWFFRCRSV